MGIANVALMLQLRAMNQRLWDRATGVFRKEQCTLIITLVCFELSYLIRFVWDEYLAYKLYELATCFQCELVYDLLSYFEALSFVALLLCHKRNFKMQIEVGLVLEQANPDQSN